MTGDDSAPDVADAQSGADGEPAGGSEKLQAEKKRGRLLRRALVAAVVLPLLAVLLATATLLYGMYRFDARGPHSAPEIVMLDPGTDSDGRLVWAWSRQGALLAAGSMRLATVVPPRRPEAPLRESLREAGPDDPTAVVDLTVVGGKVKYRRGGDVKQ